uniref:Nephrin n=1 Tax=Trichobilharzia regenti TaxID=157069 RepID=A0AA85JYH7_TRIRE|nr:unnamed protein product [Trichobilharzia regenti]
MFMFLKLLKQLWLYKVNTRDPVISFTSYYTILLVEILTSTLFVHTTVNMPKHQSYSDTLNLLTGNISSKLPPVGLPVISNWRTNLSLDFFSMSKSKFNRTNKFPSVSPQFNMYHNRLMDINKTNYDLVGRQGQTVSSASSSSSSHFVDQSGPCTPEEEADKLQCLRELPAERYEVLEGETVLMRCRVAHQRGKAQWRARNFLLGYKRNIPDWPRYSMQGDSEQGVHDLLIHNVSREDAGVFECQVSPVAGQNPLRRQTLLVILVKPTPPKILTLPGVPQPSASGQLVVAFDSNEANSANSSSLKLICQAKGGYPTPKFEWFHNGNLISTSNDNLEDENDKNDSREVNKDKFELEIDKRRLATRDRLVCLVSNKATLRSNHLYEQKLRAEIMIVIQSLPGDPEIIDWDKSMNESDGLYVGSALEATCRVNPPGNPPGIVIWRFESPNSPLQTDEFKLFGGDPAKSTINNVIPISNENVINQITDEKILSRVRISNLNSTMHGLDLICAVRNQVGPEKTTKKRIQIRHGPSYVDIYGPYERMIELKQRVNDYNKLRLTNNRTTLVSFNKQSLYVYLDRPQYLLCVTGVYYGQTEMKWQGKLHNSEQWELIAPLESFIRNEPDELNQFNLIQASIIQLVSTNTKRNSLAWSEVECIARPDFFKKENDKLISKHVNLEIYELPSVPVVTGQKGGVLLLEGTTLSLHCTAKQGNPPGKLIWTQALKGNNESEVIDESITIQQNQSKKYSDGMLFSTLNINLTKLHDGAIYKCGAMNPGYPFTSTQFSSPIQIGVAYSATALNISVISGTGQMTESSNIREELRKLLSHYKVKYNNIQIPVIQSNTGSTLKLLCQVEMSNPKPKLEWRLHHCPPVQFSSLVKRVNDTISGMKPPKDPYDAFFKSCQSIQLTGSRLEETFSDSVQNIILSSYLEIPVNISHDGDLVECLIRKYPTEYSNDSVNFQSPFEKHETSKSDFQNKHFQTLTLLSSQILLSIQFPPIFLNPAKQLNWPMEFITENTEQSAIPHYIVVEGGSLDLDLEPISNPSLSKSSWFRNGTPLPISHVTRSMSKNEKDSESLESSIIEEDTNKRIVVNPTRIIIHPVKRSDMANYTLIATNALGSNEFTFFLNVTYGPQLIGPASINVTVTGKKAELICQSEANPTPTINAVRWRRLTNTLFGAESLENLYKTSITQTTSSSRNHFSQADSAAGIQCTKGEWYSGFKYYAKCWCSSPGIMTSTLTIYDLSPNDVGRYQCHMDNGIGSPAVRTIDLTYPFEPRIVPVTRWSRAASNMILTKNKTTTAIQSHQVPDQISSILSGPHARLTCVIAAEPMPEVQWLREPANLTLIEGGQFRSIVKPIRPGLYHAILYLIQPQDVDLGRYFCKAKNLVGEDTGRVDLIRPVQPDVPSSPRLINATSSSLAVSWTQGFNGGPEQTFLLQWHANEEPDYYNKANIKEDLDNEVLTYNIMGLQKATTYRVSVGAYNILSTATSFTPYLLASTTAFDSVSDEEAMRDEAKAKSSQKDVQKGHWDTKWLMNSKDSGNPANPDSQRRSVRSGHELNSSEDNAFVIITAVSVFGSFILIANLLIILIFTRNKRQKLKRQERKASASGELMQIYPMENGYPEIHTNPQTNFSMYPDEMRLNGSYMLQANPQDQFSPFQNGWEQIPLNICADQTSSIMRGNQMFTNSPHSSMKAMNMQNFNSPNHIEFNNRPPSDISIQHSSVFMNNPDPNTLAYLNPDASAMEAIQNMQDYHDCPEFMQTNFSNNTSPFNYDMDHIPRNTERPTPTHPRVVSVGRTLTDRSNRNRSPHSGAASSVSTIRSNGHGNTNSLERNISTFQRSHHTNLLGDYRQLGVGLTLPNGGLGPNILTPSPHQNANSRNFQSSPSNWIQQSGMTTSFHGARTPSWRHYPNSLGNEEYGSSALSGQQMGRNSYNAFAQQPLLQRMNSFELPDSYTPNNRQQTNSNKSSDVSSPRYHQESSLKYMTHLEENRTPLGQNNNDYRNVNTDFPSNGSTIPPPNDFQTNSSHIPYIQINCSTPTVSRPYFHNPDENENIIVPAGVDGDHIQGSNQQRLAIPRNISNELMTHQNQNNYSSYGCVL